MPNHTNMQTEHKKLYRKNLLLFGDQKIMFNEEEMSLKERVNIVLDSMPGPDRGKKARLARIAGCTGPVINHWINGEQQDMKFDHAQRIATALNFRVEWLLTGKGPKKPGEGEELLKHGLHPDEPASSSMYESEIVDPENDLWLKVTARELKLLNRYRNATEAGKMFIEMASINAPKDIPGKH